MFRGFTKFQCANCGNKFRGPDFEYAATVYSVPLRCPECGSWHTAPSGLLNTDIYRQIWQFHDQCEKESQARKETSENGQNSN